MSGRRRSPRSVWLGIGIILSALVTLGIWLLLDVPPYPAWLGGAGVALFMLYGIDKRRARVRGGRVPEMVLHALALAGGFAGGWAGRALFRHKTRHLSFGVVLLLSTVLHGALLFLLYR